MIKYILLSTFLSLSAFSFENFTKDFSLKNVRIDGKFALITLEHYKTYTPTRFELIPFQSCMESFPPQCSGTIVRLDHQWQSEEIVQTVIEVDMEKTFNLEGPVNVAIKGPKKEIRVQY